MYIRETGFDAIGLLQLLADVIKETRWWSGRG